MAITGRQQRCHRRMQRARLGLRRQRQLRQQQLLPLCRTRRGELMPRWLARVVGQVQMKPLLKQVRLSNIVAGRGQC